MCEFCSRYVWISPFLPKKTGFSCFFFRSWWIPFTLWMLAHGRFQSPERTGRDTIYLRLMLTDSVAGANCGVRTPPRGTKLGATPAAALDDAASVAATMKYMVFHALACHLSFVSSALCMTYIYVHLFFALAGLVFSLYLGLSLIHI